MEYRRSEEKDIQQIRELLSRHYGVREHALVNANNGEYLLAIDNEKIVGMTSISNFQSRYTGYEIGYTALDTEYRGQGIITKMLIMEIERVGRDQNIYCRCWRRNNNEIYLKHAMEQLGFKLVIRNHAIYDSRYENVCENGCIHYSTKHVCVCYEDLYVLSAINKGDKKQ